MTSYNRLVFSSDGLLTTVARSMQCICINILIARTCAHPSVDQRGHSYSRTPRAARAHAPPRSARVRHNYTCNVQFKVTNNELLAKADTNEYMLYKEAL